MAKKKTPQTSGASDAQQGETIAGYFRKVLQESPRLLNERSNAELLARWLADHPGEKEASQSVKNGLANLKSVLRSKKRKRIARRAQANQPAGPEPRTAVTRVPTGSSKLEALEYQIDECLISAKQLDREGLHDVIALLRRARNTVVWKMG